MKRIFDEAAMLDASRAQVPAGDFGDESFLQPMRALLAALEHEAQLEPVGQWAAVARIVAALNRRRRLSDLLARRPDIADRPIDSPVFILGFPRTGTTLLHNLLAADPNHRAIRLWEMREPFAPADAGPDWAQEVIATTTQLVKAGYQLSPRLADIHPLRPTWPDECSWLFRNSFASMVLAFSYFVPSYVEFLVERDARPDYAYYRLQLQAILAQRPGQPLILKDPCHLWNLGALLETFPDARIVHLHRPIEQVLPSFCSLQRALQEGGARARTDAEIGSYAAAMLETAMGRALEVRAGLVAGRIIDLDYRDLVADPRAAVVDLYARLGLAHTPAAASAAATWLEQNRGLSGKHRYSLEMFGLSCAALDRRFGAYSHLVSSLSATA